MKHVNKLSSLFLLLALMLLQTRISDMSIGCDKCVMQYYLFRNRFFYHS